MGGAIRDAYCPLLSHY